MKNINKKFQGVSALKDVSLEIAPNEIMCLLGENGAGKSTLIKILSGSILPDSGEILFNNKLVNIKSPRIATETGISVVHQELDLVPDLTVQQNLFLGRVETRFGIIKTKKLREQSMKAIERVGGKFSPDSIVSNLTVVERQLTMIARALTIKAKLLIMDEPSATLTAEELEQVFIVAKEVVKTGCSILYISHRMDEIFKIGDRATVLRDGKTVVLPRINGNDLEWVKWNGDPNKLITKKKIMEPQGEALNDLSQISAVIVPALRIDQSGYRLGQGGGFYDRALTKLNAWSIGLIHPDEISSVDLPREEFDMPLNAAATPDLILRFNS
jgi:5,10-methenyltetrahydrofolate synthetase